jgi:hypothetical protein
MAHRRVVKLVGKSVKLLDVDNIEGPNVVTEAVSAGSTVSVLSETKV